MRVRSAALAAATMANSRFQYVKKFELPDALMQDTYLITRLDGHRFTKFTADHGFMKPNDERGLLLMAEVGRRKERIAVSFFGMVDLSRSWNMIRRCSRRGSRHCANSSYVTQCVTVTARGSYSCCDSESSSLELNLSICASLVGGVGLQTPLVFCASCQLL